MSPNNHLDKSPKNQNRSSRNRNWRNQTPAIRFGVNAADVNDIGYDYLEARQLLAAAIPSTYDQYMVELINLARANPTAYAQSLGINLNEGLAPGRISGDAKAPIAINPFLTDAAQKHSQWMEANDRFSHAGAGGSSYRQRMEAAGYVFHTGAIWGENIALELKSQPINLTDATKSMQEKLFRDTNTAGRWHRLNILEPRFREIGVGVDSGNYVYNGKTYHAALSTQDFAKSGGQVFLTGVAYSDTVLRNSFYTPGEGLGGVSIRAVKDGTGETYTTATWTSGGYSLALPAGKYSVFVSGGNIGASQFYPSVTIGTENVKFDFKKGTVARAPEIAVTGNTKHIAHKSTATSPTNYTDFGSINVSQGQLTRPFRILNLGNVDLRMTSANRVHVVGPNRTDFTVAQYPDTSVPGGNGTTFKIKFDPSGAGLRTATIRVWSNDADERPFEFAVVGTGVVVTPARYALAFSPVNAIDGSTTAVVHQRDRVVPNVSSFDGEMVSALRTHDVDRLSSTAEISNWSQDPNGFVFADTDKLGESNLLDGWKTIAIDVDRVFAQLSE